MLMPSIFRNNFFDNFFDAADKEDMSIQDKFLPRRFGNMKADITEVDNKYRIEVEVPGFTKDDLSLELKDGYLVVKAEQSKESDEKDKDKKIIRQERYFGSMTRAFYVGDAVDEASINAKFENGILTVEIPKVEEPKEEPKLIAIN